MEKRVIILLTSDLNLQSKKEGLLKREMRIRLVWQQFHFSMKRQIVNFCTLVLYLIKHTQKQTQFENVRYDMVMMGA